MAVSQSKIGIRRSPLNSIHFSCISFSLCKFRSDGQNRKKKDFPQGKQTVGGEYTGAWRDVDKVLDAVSSVVSESDYIHIKRILTQGCPHSFKFEESPENKARALARGNQKFCYK